MMRLFLYGIQYVQYRFWWIIRDGRLALTLLKIWFHYFFRDQPLKRKGVLHFLGRTMVFKMMHSLLLVVRIMS